MPNGKQFPTFPDSLTVVCLEVMSFFLDRGKNVHRNVGNIKRRLLYLEDGCRRILRKADNDLPVAIYLLT